MYTTAVFGGPKLENGLEGVLVTILSKEKKKKMKNES
jgi:hypothetical protein